MSEYTVTQEVLIDMLRVLQSLRASKPNDRSARDRAWAVTITEQERAIAFFVTFVAEPNDWQVAQGARAFFLDD